MVITPFLLFILGLIGVATGVAGGLFGIGGGTIIVPILVFLLGFEQTVAQGISLAAMLLPVEIFAALKYKKAGTFDLKSSLLIGLGLMIGALPGALLAVSISVNILKICYAVFLFYISWRFIQPIYCGRWFIHGIQVKMGVKEPISLEGKGEKKSLVALEPVRNWYWMFLVGIVGGIASGFFGIGGAAIIIPALTLLFHFNYHEAKVISLGALLPPVGLFGMLTYIFHETNSGADTTSLFPVAAAITVGMFLGSYFGALIGLNTSKDLVKRLYGVFLLWVVGYYLYETLPLIFR